MPRSKTRRQILFAVISLGMTVGILSYLYKYVSYNDVIQIIKEVNRNALAIFILLSFAQSFFRTWRYQILLKLSGYEPGKTALFLVVLIRNFFSDLLPARLGTLIYVFLANTRLGIPMGPAASSFAIAFLFDILALVPLIILATGAAMTKAQLFSFPLIVAGVLLGGMVTYLIYALPRLCSILVNFLEKVRFIRNSWRKRFQNFLTSAAAEMIKARKGGVYGPVMSLSLLVRISKYGSLYVFLYALLQPFGYALQDLYIPNIFLGICASELSASLPISGIAGFGAYEGTWALVFSLLDFPVHIARLTAVSHHLFTQVYGYGLGAMAFLVILLPFFKAKGTILPQQHCRRQGVSFYPKAGISMVCLLLLLFGVAKLPLAKTKGTEPAATEQPPAREVNERFKLSTHFKGKILFDSNRSGTFGIYVINVDGTGLNRIIDHPEWHEMYPDPSPDGRYIVFSRAKTTSRLAPSEIWIINRTGKKPRKLSDDGVFPTFGGDGKSVYFERQRKKVMAIDPGGKQGREIFPNQNKKFNRFQIVKPRVSADGTTVTFTSNRPNAWTAWYAFLDTGKAFQIEHGCEPVPFVKSKKIAWLNNKFKGVKERSGIFVYEMSNGSYQTLQDADAPRGHEYFPTLAADDRYLLYSACRENEHAHETANYQIFVKDLKTGNVVRVTFDAYTNRWPKMLPNP